MNRLEAAKARLAARQSRYRTWKDIDTFREASPTDLERALAVVEALLDQLEGAYECSACHGVFGHGGHYEDCPLAWWEEETSVRTVD